MKKKIIVLGSTGSIGESTLDVARNFPDLFEIVGLSAHARKTRLLIQQNEFNCSACCLSGLQAQDPDFPYYGEQGILQMLRNTEADIVVNGIAGAKGFLPSLVSLETKKDLALANKETMVMAGPLVIETAVKNNCKILPVDSEHSALFFLIEKHGKPRISELILTASGGAFRDTPKHELANVTIADALSHPTWTMGKKITIDSATMANKGLEVIEAVELFDFTADNIKVTIHPQSMVHSLVRTTDGSLYAQISSPDMRVPIQNALSYPDQLPCKYGYMDIINNNLTFKPVEAGKFPMLETAFFCAKERKAYPVAYNAANEVAVKYFLQESISFLAIPETVAAVLEPDWGYLLGSTEEILDADTRARNYAEKYIKENLLS
ncbi:MAG: 1-deoxy-D-xylulose-5-phosphate reductoisomerase [Spirochaetia bacterium]